MATGLALAHHDPGGREVAPAAVAGQPLELPSVEVGEGRDGGELSKSLEGGSKRRRSDAIGEKTLEAALVEREDLRPRRRPDRGIPRCALEQPDLADGVARTHPSQLA